MQAILLYWSAAQHQTIIVKRQKIGLFYVKFSAEFNELCVFLLFPFTLCCFSEISFEDYEASKGRGVYREVYSEPCQTTKGGFTRNDLYDTICMTLIQL